MGNVKPTLLIVVIGLAITGLFGYHMVYVPQQRKVALIQTQIAQSQSDQQSREEVAALFSAIEHYRKRLPENSDPSWLAREVVAIGKASGVQFTTLNQQVPEDRAQYTRLSINLAFSASYHELGAFIDAIESSEHFMRVDHLVVGPPTPGSEKASVQLVLSTITIPKIAPGAPPGA